MKRKYGVSTLCSLLLSTLLLLGALPAHATVQPLAFVSHISSDGVPFDFFHSNGNEQIAGINPNGSEFAVRVAPISVKPNVPIVNEGGVTKRRKS